VIIKMLIITVILLFPCGYV